MDSDFVDLPLKRKTITRKELIICGLIVYMLGVFCGYAMSHEYIRSRLYTSCKFHSSFSIVGYGDTRYRCIGAGNAKAESAEG